MDKPTWGCPECGSADVVQHVTLTATRPGEFVARDDRWEFDEGDVDRDTLDVSDEGKFECNTCGEEFDSPSRVNRQTGIRLALRIRGSAFEPDEHGVEQELDDDLTAKFEVMCEDKEQAKRLFETLRLFVGSLATATAKKEAA
jgi:hypothetical protein